MAGRARWKAYLWGLALLLAGAAGLWFGPGREPLDRLLHGVEPGVELAGRPVGGLYREEVGVLLEEWALETYRPPIDADIDQATGRITPGRDGMRLDVPTTLEEVMRAERGEHIELSFEWVPHRWEAGDLAELRRPIGRAVTFAQGTPERVHNIRKAMSHVNNMLLYPGETLSFLVQQPEFKESEGWRRAPVIMQGDFVPGLGGGVCQASTTLYIAVRRAGLEIVERHPHSRPIHYVPEGWDAAVADPWADLKVRNNTAAPVLIKAGVGGRAVMATVLTLPPERLKEIEREEEGRPESSSGNPTSLLPAAVTGTISIPAGAGC